MREILFRGKSVNGYWIYGNLNFYPDINRTFIRKNNKELLPSFQTSLEEEVSKNTVGQYTGLTDKNGTKIFEGDIVEGHCHSQWSHRLQRCVVVYDRDSFKSRHYLNYPNEEHYFEYKVLFSKDVVVIGNIHDNPELLESEVQGE